MPAGPNATVPDSARGNRQAEANLLQLGSLQEVTASSPRWRLPARFSCQRPPGGQSPSRVFRVAAVNIGIRSERSALPTSGRGTSRRPTLVTKLLHCARFSVLSKSFGDRPYSMPSGTAVPVAVPSYRVVARIGAGTRRVGCLHLAQTPQFKEASYAFAEDLMAACTPPAKPLCQNVELLGAHNQAWVRPGWPCTNAHARISALAYPVCESAATLGSPAHRRKQT
jgi:hypothetical protein